MPVNDSALINPKAEISSLEMKIAEPIWNFTCRLTRVNDRLESSLLWLSRNYLW